METRSHIETPAAPHIRIDGVTVAYARPREAGAFVPVSEARLDIGRGTFITVWFLYSAPLVALFPLFIIWFGLGVRPVIAIAFLLSVTPITTNTLSGIKGVSPALLRAAKSFGAGKRDLLWRVILPASVPMVIAGLRLGIGRALTGVVVGELFGATAGLGFSIAYYGGLLKTTNMLASLAVIAVLGVVCTQGLSAVEARLDSWRTGPGL
jgi:NitT/TauT family transport system permease protein